MKKVSFQMPDDMHRRLSEEARVGDVSMSQVCREAVRDKLLREGHTGSELLEAMQRAVAPPDWAELAEHEGSDAGPELFPMALEIEAELTFEVESVPKRGSIPQEPWYVRYAEQVGRFHRSAPGPSPPSDDTDYQGPGDLSMWYRD